MVKGRIGWLLAVAVFAASCAGTPGVEVEDATRLASGDTVDPADTAEQTEQDEPSDTAPPPETTPTGPAGVGDSLYPELGNGGYDVEHYSLAMDVDVESNEIDATATIEAVAAEQLDLFHLDLHALDVIDVSVDGRDAVGVERDGHEVIITPAQPIEANAPFTVDVRYGGTPEPIQDPAIPFDTIGWHQREGTIYVASEPSGAMSWFPSNNHPTDKATFEIAITTDSRLTVVANGVLDGTAEAGDGRSTTTWRMDDPMTTYLAAVYIGDFELEESMTDDGVRIRNYFPPPFADDLADEFELTADVIDYYEELFAADYPFAEYGSIVLPFRLGFALENQTISVHGLDATDPYTIAHEILHQWSGNSVTVSDWQDIWMLEGFATYLAYMYFEDRGLPSDIEPQGMYAALRAGSTGPAEVPIDDLFGVSVYFRGGMTLHALRVEVGDDVFGEILATYYDRYAGEDVSTDDFRELVAEVAGSGAAEVLDEWLYGVELPPFPE